MKMKKGNGVAYGLIIGLMIGIFSDNIGLWLSMGIVFGAAYETQLVKKKPTEERG